MKKGNYMYAPHQHVYALNAMPQETYLQLPVVELESTGWAGQVEEWPTKYLGQANRGG